MSKIKSKMVFFEFKACVIRYILWGNSFAPSPDINVTKHMATLSSFQNLDNLWKFAKGVDNDLI